MKPPNSRKSWSGIAALLSLLCLSTAMAQETAPPPPQETAPPPSRAREDNENLRLFQQFFTDAAITSQWWEGQLRVPRGAVPPVEKADGVLLTGVMAVSPAKNVEVGGRISYVDYDLDHGIFRPGDTKKFTGESGASDLDVFGKYRVINGPMQLAFGGSLTFPTGSEDEGLGNGKLVPAVFGAVRGDLAGGPAGNLIGVGHLGFRFNRNTNILGFPLEGKTSVFLGAGIIGKWQEDLHWSGEITIESDRYTGADSDVRLTAGLQWNPARHHLLRGAAAVGLADAAPDFELFLAYAYTF